MVSVEFLDFEPTFQDDATKSCVSHGNLIGKFVSNNLAAIARCSGTRCMIRKGWKQASKQNSKRTDRLLSVLKSRSPKLPKPPQKKNNFQNRKNRLLAQSKPQEKSIRTWIPSCTALQGQTGCDLAPQVRFCLRGLHINIHVHIHIYFLHIYIYIYIYIYRFWVFWVSGFGVLGLGLWV